VQKLENSLKIDNFATNSPQKSKDKKKFYFPIETQAI
jgi:hypothetical protein